MDRSGSKEAILDSKNGLRMNHLVDATGVPKSTILYYLRQGLLPEPYKSSPNMAYYDPVCVEIIRFIQYMQKKHRLSLNEIRELLEKGGPEAHLSAQLQPSESVFGPEYESAKLDAEMLCQAVGLTNDQLQALLQNRLLIPGKPGVFDEQDLRMAKILVKAFNWGLQPEDLTFYVDLAEQIIAQEFALRRRVTTNLPVDQEAAVTLQLLDNARISRAYIIERLFQERVAEMKDLKTG